ncbi:MAG: DNA-directed RNA polymerase subunit L [Candidatus Hadarchaeales archaeon]
MEVEAVEKEGEKLRIRITGGDHTLCNLLRDELSKEDGVKAVAYRIEHPLTEPPELHIQTRGRSPKSTIASTSKRIAREVGEFRELFQKAIKKSE